MTTATAEVMTASDQADAQETHGVCWDCFGPCLTYKGTEHGWRCRSCLRRYLEEAAARCEAKQLREAQKEHEKLLRKTRLTADTG
jgi:tRNA(Ile2) C34 agmatinyltransferase TiaS